MCVEWKALYREHSVPAQIGVELTGLERDGEVWKAVAWNHNLKAEQNYRARHVVLAFGRGVPRRLDIPGDVAGLAFGLTDAAKYVGEPVLRDRRRHVGRRSRDRDLQRQGVGQRSVGGVLVVPRRQDAEGVEGARRRVLRRVHRQRQRALPAEQRAGGDARQPTGEIIPVGADHRASSRRASPPKPRSSSSRRRSASPASAKTFPRRC